MAMVEEQSDRHREVGESGGAPPRYGWDVVVRHRVLIAGCVVLAIITGVAFTMLASPIYEATTSIRIDEQKTGLRINGMLDDLSRSGQVSTEMEVLRSRVLAEQVVDSLGLQVQVIEPRRGTRVDVLSVIRASRDARPAQYTLRRGEDGRFVLIDEATDEERGPFDPGETVQVDGAMVRLAPDAERHDQIRFAVQPFAQAVQRLTDALEVTRPISDASVVEVRYESPDVHLAREVPNALASAFVSRRQDVQSMDARRHVAFLQEQIGTITAQLRAAEDSLRRFQESVQIASLQEEARTQVDQIADLQAERNAVETERAPLSQLLNEVRAKKASPSHDGLSPYRRLLGYPSMLRNQAASHILGSLIEVENRRVELLKRRSERDPDVRALSERIEELEAQIHSIASTYLDALSNKAGTLDSTLAAFGNELARIPTQRMEMARLERQTRILGDIYTLLQTRLKEAEITAATRDHSIRVVDPAIRPVEPIRPRMAVNVVLAAMLGLVIGFGTAVTRDVLDTTVHTPQDIKEITGVPVLGRIPRIQAASARPTANAAGRQRLITDRDPANPVAEAYRALRTNVTFSRPGESIRTLLLTSPVPGDGKSTTTANLAVTFALQGQRVVLVDADLRRGMLFKTLEGEREPGLSNVALGTADADDTLQEIPVGEGAALHFMPTGTLPPNPSELLASAGVKDIIARLEEQFDIVLVDSPPVNVVTDAALLSRNVDGVIIVTRADSTERTGLRHTVQQLRNVQAPTLGTVLNDIVYTRGHRNGSYYGGYGSYYYAYDETEHRRAMPVRIAARLGWDRLPWTNG